MAAYAVGLCNIQDLSWLSAYRAKVPALLARHGGRYIARAVGSTWEVLEGTRPPITGVTVLEFPSMGNARAWHNDPEYAPLITLRQARSKLDLLLVEGSDG